MKRTKYPIHPDFQKWANMNPPLHKATIPVMQKLMGLLFTRERSTADVTVERKVIPVGGGTIRALWYCPKDVGEHAPCLLYYHGGGFVLPAALYHYSLAKEYAQRAHCKVLFVDYRLAPRFPFPAAPEDCYLAYAWAAANAGDLSIDTSRMAVAGDSAGGALATVVCLMAKERGQLMPCGQMMMYPVTGIGMETESMKKYTPLCATARMPRSTTNYTGRPPLLGNWNTLRPSKRNPWPVCLPRISRQLSFTVCGTGVSSMRSVCGNLVFRSSCTTRKKRCTDSISCCTARLSVTVLTGAPHF